MKAFEHRLVLDSCHLQDLVLQGEDTVIVIEADWSGTLEMVKSTIYNTLGKFQSQTRAYAVPIQEVGQDIGGQRITSFPTFLFYKDGQLVNRVSGLENVGRLENQISDLIKNR